MTDVKVNRDGTVTRNGEIIGSVVASMGYSGIGAAIMGEPNQKQWTPTLPDGTPVGDAMTPRKRAVALLDRATRPTEVTDIEIDHAWGSGKPFIYANLHYKGNLMGVSSYAHEIDADGNRQWCVDFMWTAAGVMPSWSHGKGDRSVRKQCLNAELAAIVTAATTEWLAKLDA